MIGLSAVAVNSRIPFVPPYPFGKFIHYTLILVRIYGDDGYGDDTNNDNGCNGQWAMGDKRFRSIYFYGDPLCVLVCACVFVNVDNRDALSIEMTNI